jgi:voltage-gated potassium channel
MTSPLAPVSRRLQLGCGLLGAILLMGMIGFMALEGWDAITALYTTMLVVSTLGFSDLRPTDTPGRLLTMALITGGVGTLYYLVGALAQTVIENNLDWGKQRNMEQQIARLTDHYIVCGYGRVGQEICRQLAQQSCTFVVVDNAPERIERIRAAGCLVVEGDASDDAVLRQAGVTRARRLLTAVKSDAGNVYITLSARALNPKLFIVARAATAEAEHKLTIAGANRVISPYVLGGRTMAGMALRPAVMDFLELLVHSDDLEMWLEEVPVEAGSSLEGVAVGEARLREEVGISVLAVRHADGRMAVNPSPNLVLRAGDKLIALGTHGGIEKTSERQPLDVER